MSIADEKTQNAITSGRLISIAWQELGPMLQEQRKNAMIRLTQEFRAGKRAEDLYPFIATLVAVEDLEHEARNKILRGESAAKEMTNAEVRR